MNETYSEYFFINFEFISIKIKENVLFIFFTFKIFISPHLLAWSLQSSFRTETILKFEFLWRHLEIYTQFSTMIPITHIRSIQFQTQSSFFLHSSNGGPYQPLLLPPKFSSSSPGSCSSPVSELLFLFSRAKIDAFAASWIILSSASKTIPLFLFCRSLFGRVPDSYEFELNVYVSCHLLFLISENDSCSCHCLN